MLPIRTRSIFKSRWIALLWAAGVCWTAVEIAGGQDAPAGDNAATAPADAEALNTAAGALLGQ